MKTPQKQLDYLKNRWIEFKVGNPLLHDTYKKQMREFMQPFRIEVPKGFVGTMEALKILGFGYKQKLYYHKNKFNYVVLNDKIGRHKSRGRWYWEVKSLINIKER